MPIRRGDWWVFGPGEDVRCPSREYARFDRRQDDRRGNRREGTDRRRRLLAGGQCLQFAQEALPGTEVWLRVQRPELPVEVEPPATSHICRGCGMRHVTQQRRVAAAATG